MPNFCINSRSGQLALLVPVVKVDQRLIRAPLNGNQKRFVISTCGHRTGIKPLLAFLIHLRAVIYMLINCLQFSLRSFRRTREELPDRLLSSDFDFRFTQMWDLR